MSKLFNFVASDYASDFATHGFSVVKNCINAEFLDYAKRQAEKCKVEQNISRAKRLLKREYLFDFPDDDQLIVDLVTTLGGLTGLPADELIISERHIKIYRDDAPTNPLPHKDRRGTQLSVGMPLKMPDASRLVLYPYHERAENTFNSFDDFLVSLSEAQLPQNALRGVAPLEMDTRPGDLIVFYGSTIWHERTHAAGAQLLYLKINALGLDPLGENIASLPLEKRQKHADFRTKAAVAA